MSNLNQEKMFKKLEFYQNIIARMNTSSMQIKVVTYMILTILLASSIKYSIVVLLPVILLWVLDSYYLAQERGFRKKYNELADLNLETCISMKITNPFVSKKRMCEEIFNSFKSITMLLSYSPIIIVVVVFYFTK